MLTEYKRALLASVGVDDTNDERSLGRLSEQAGDARGTFVVVEKQLGDRDMRAQLLNKIGGL
jgi:hypothetical protein